MNRKLCVASLFVAVLSIVGSASVAQAQYYGSGGCSSCGQSSQSIYSGYGYSTYSQPIDYGYGYGMSSGYGCGSCRRGCGTTVISGYSDMGCSGTPSCGCSRCSRRGCGLLGGLFGWMHCDSYCASPCGPYSYGIASSGCGIGGCGLGGYSMGCAPRIRCAKRCAWDCQPVSTLCCQSTTLYSSGTAACCSPAPTCCGATSANYMPAPSNATPMTPAPSSGPTPGPTPIPTTGPTPTPDSGVPSPMPGT